jgi:hypothetical protein
LKAHLAKEKINSQRKEVVIRLMLLIKSKTDENRMFGGTDYAANLAEQILSPEGGG